MRDDELSRVPKSIEPWRVMEFVESLGIEPKDMYEMTVGVRQVVLRVYATGESGQRYVGKDGKNAAEHVVSVAYLGPWKKPGPDERVEAAAVEVWRIECDHADPGHGIVDWPKDWQDLLTEDEREEYRTKGRELLRRLGALQA